MSLDNIICPGCDGKDILVKEEHKFLNFIVGAAIGGAIGTTVIDLSLSLPLAAGIGTTYYFADIPFGSEIEYCCKKCNYNWDAD